MKPAEAQINLADYGIEIAYGREDVRYETWFSDWMKGLAIQHTVEELAAMLPGFKAESEAAAKAHHRAVTATHSMSAKSATRAHNRNRVYAAGEHLIAIRGAITIHALFPEHAKAPDRGPDRNRGATEGGVAPHHEPAQVMAHGGSAGSVSPHPPLLAPNKGDR